MRPMHPTQMQVLSVFMGRWELSIPASPFRFNTFPRLPAGYHSFMTQRNISLFCGARWMVLSVFFTVLAGGCGTATLPVVQVTGKVTLKGNPIDGAMVTFVPDESEGRTASGTTGENGEFLIMTQGATKAGCLPGSYRVIISKHIDVDEQGNPVAPLGEAPPFADPSAPPQRMPISKSMLPDRYGKTDTSGLTAEVTRRGPNSFVFDLTE